MSLASGTTCSVTGCGGCRVPAASGGRCRSRRLGAGVVAGCWTAGTTLTVGAMPGRVVSRWRVTRVAAVVMAVHEHVAELVGQRPDRRAGVQSWQDADAARG